MFSFQSIESSGKGGLTIGRRSLYNLPYKMLKSGLLEEFWRLFVWTSEFWGGIGTEKILQRVILGLEVLK
jgi:hypothetical protein